MTSRDRFWAGRRAALCLFPAFCVVVMVSACSSEAGGQEPSPVVSQMTADPTVSTSQSPAETSAPVETSQPVQTSRVDSTASFVSPSDNIRCVLGDDGGDDVGVSYAGCHIAQADWAGPAEPSDCELDWFPLAVWVSADGTDLGDCRGDAFAFDADRLDYGQALAVGDVVCRSEASGVTCENLTTRTGFTIARSGLTLF